MWEQLIPMLSGLFKSGGEAGGGLDRAGARVHRGSPGMAGLGTRRKDAGCGQFRRGPAEGIA